MPSIFTAHNLCWAGEHDEDNVERLDELKWASWSNRRSFWPLKESLMQTIYEVGFDLVVEQFDWMAPEIAASMTQGPYATQARGFFVIKTRVGRQGTRRPQID